MKFLIAFAAVLVVSSAQFNNFRPQPARVAPRPVLRPAPAVVAVVARGSSSDQAANIVRYDNDVGPDGSYSYAVETDNGISAQAQGSLRDLGGNPPAAAVVSQGSFAWTSPEGQPIGITYIADENGYQPSGDAIPTSPPIPEPIVRSLEYIARNAPRQ